MGQINLLPMPRRLQRTEGTLPLSPGRPRVKSKWSLPELGPFNCLLEVKEQPRQPTDQYILEISPGGIEISATTPAMAFHAAQTLRQLLRQFPRELPCLRIDDWPDFPARGVMLDISRDKVPTMATLFALVDQLSELKINQLQLYTEHTFAYSKHRAVWKDASPMTADDIRQLDTYCRQRFIELVPNQNSFGHMERWLKHPEYEHLAECPQGFEFPWGVRMPGGFSLNPLDPRSLELIESLYEELLPNFTNQLFNVGCDETFDLGLGKSKAEVERRGASRVYLDFLLKIYQAVKRRGRTMMFWGDIILHKPELLGELPRDMIALNWGYDADHKFHEQTRAFQQAGVPFYVCPGTSSWCSIAGKTDNAIANLKSAAVNGLNHGSIGYLNTDWGDLGHLQYLPVSYLGFAAGAAYSWCYESNRDVALAAALDLHVFRDAAGVVGKLVHDLGNVYQCTRQDLSNATAMFWVLVGGQERRKLYQDVTIEEYGDVEKRIGQVMTSIAAARMDRPDAALIVAEMNNAAAMLVHACRRGQWLRDPSMHDRATLTRELQAVIVEHRRLWLARNRPGGLKDSAARLEKLLLEYQARQ